MRPGLTTAACAIVSAAACAVALCLLALGAPGVHAVIGRHDVDLVANADARRRFAAVGKVLPDGEAVLIAPDRVLTAAHVATGAPRERLRVRFEGLSYRVARVVPYEGWSAGRHDIAVMCLARPVQRVEPLELYRGELRQGDEVLLAGRGDHGDGMTGVRGNDGAFRVAENVVAGVDAERIDLRLDAPGDGALPREGVSGAGDSGTPALVERNGRLLVAGIGSVGRSPAGRRYGVYGSADVFVPTAPYRDWIEEACGG